jgi:hypothetical protein
MADLSKLRKKIKPVVSAASGSAILVAGLIGGCGSVNPPITTGNLLPPDIDVIDGDTQDEGAQQSDFFISGNLMPPDVTEADEGKPPVDEGGAVDEGISEPDVIISGNLMPPDVQEFDEGAPPADEGGAVDVGVAEPDVFISGNLMPPDVIEMPAEDVSESDEDTNDGPEEAEENQPK